MKTTVDKAWRYTRALSRWIKAGRPVRTEREIQALFEEQCSSCEKFDSKNCSCSVCGCRINLSKHPYFNKLAMATESCPKEKW